MLLKYLYFEKQTSTSKAIVGKYDFFGKTKTNKTLTDFYTYKDRQTTMDYLNKVTERTLTDAERAKIVKMQERYGEMLMDEQAVYDTYLDDEGRIKWN